MKTLWTENKTPWTKTKTHVDFKLLRKITPRNYKDLYGKPCERDWMAKVVFLKQMLPTFGGRCNRYFWDIRLKMLRLPNFNMLFQLVLTKFFKSELFSCLPKVDHVIKSLKEPIEGGQRVTKNLFACNFFHDPLRIIWLHAMDGQTISLNTYFL